MGKQTPKSSECDFEMWLVSVAHADRDTWLISKSADRVAGVRITG